MNFLESSTILNYASCKKRQRATFWSTQGIFITLKRGLQMHENSETPLPTITQDTDSSTILAFVMISVVQREINFLLTLSGTSRQSGNRPMSFYLQVHYLTSAIFKRDID